VLKEYLTKSRYITTRSPVEPSFSPRRPDYSSSVGSRWKRLATTSTTSCTPSRAASSVPPTGPVITIGVHSGRLARPSPSPKRPVFFEFRASPARLNFMPCRADPWAYPSAHGPTRNCLNVSGSFRAARNYKSPKFTLWPEIQFLAQNSH
jgi:hypothetical protein